MAKRRKTKQSNAADVTVPAASPTLILNFKIRNGNVVTQKITEHEIKLPNRLCDLVASVIDILFIGIEEIAFANGIKFSEAPYIDIEGNGSNEPTCLICHNIERDCQCEGGFWK